MEKKREIKGGRIAMENPLFQELPQQEVTKNPAGRFTALWEVMTGKGAETMLKPDKITALYCRFHAMTNYRGDSSSIVNQKAISSKYAKENHFSNTLFFVDDGFSGTNFNCPSWSELLERIETGKVAALIVKDMSRLGRNYLKMIFYTEVLFMEKGLRFISINNGIARKLRRFTKQFQSYSAAL